MKIIILAAGQGKRLMPLTQEIPKCMVKFRGIHIIDYIISAAKKANISEIGIVTGYKNHILVDKFKKNKQVIFFENKLYASTNMMFSLACAKPFFDDDLIISYSDIIYTPEILTKLALSPFEISVVIDKNWKNLWSMRMDDPLSDAESLKISNGIITDIGHKVNSYSDIEGQYIGLIKISKKFLRTFFLEYESLSNSMSKSLFENLYMTDFLQYLVKRSYKLSPVFIKGDWIEIDSVSDLEAYEKNNISFDTY